MIFSLRIHDLPGKICHPEADNRKALQMQVEGRVVFQMDQIELANNGILRDLGECSNYTGLGCDSGLCFGSHHQKGAENRPQPLHNLTDFVRHPI